MNGSGFINLNHTFAVMLKTLTSMIQREVFQSNLHLESQRNKESRNLDSGISLLVYTFVIEESSSVGAAVNGVDLCVLVRVHNFSSCIG